MSHKYIFLRSAADHIVTSARFSLPEEEYFRFIHILTEWNNRVIRKEVAEYMIQQLMSVDGRLSRNLCLFFEYAQ